jgi:glycosyltransferase involved in cell wall biosynthesis
LRQKAKNYDVILAANFPFNTVNYSIRYAKKFNVPIAVMALAHLDDEYYHWKHYYDALSQANIVLANSPYSESVYNNQWGINAAYVGPGFDKKEMLSETISGERFRQMFGLHDLPFVLYVGRKSQPKRYDLLARAIDIVNETTICKFVLIGPDHDKQPIEAKNTIYLGIQERNIILDAFDACNVFSMMSESESFGMVFPEAWMRKKPVIGNRLCRPVASQIRDGVDGFLCTNEYEIADRVIQLINNPQLAKQMGKAGFDKTIHNLTWERLANKVYNIYQQLIENNPK